MASYTRLYNFENSNYYSDYMLELIYAFIDNRRMFFWQRNKLNGRHILTINECKSQFIEIDVTVNKNTSDILVYFTKDIKINKQINKERGN